MYKVFILFIAVFTSVTSFAHSGHDHNLSSSTVIHMLWISPLAVAALLLAKYVKRRFDEIEESKKD